VSFSTIQHANTLSPIINPLLLQTSINTPLVPPFPLSPHQTPPKPRLRIPRNLRTQTRISPHLLNFLLCIPLRPLRRNGIRVLENENILILGEEAIEIFESAVRGFRVEKVDYGDKGGIEDGPDDVEFPLQRIDPDWGDFDD
jgi:hypothetical protein